MTKKGWTEPLPKPSNASSNGDSDVVLRTLSEHDPVLRRRAAQALIHHPDWRAVERLIELLHDDDASVRFAAVSALVRYKSEPVAAALIGAFVDENGGVRDQVVKVLALMKGQAVGPLIRTVSDPAADARMRSGAADVLGRIHERRAMPALAAAVRLDPDAQVRATAAQALGELHFEGALGPLREAFADEALGLLIQALTDDAGSVRESAAYALGYFARSAWAVARMMAPLIGALADPHSEVRRLAAITLGIARDKRALPHLRQMRRHDPGESEWGINRVAAAAAIRRIKRGMDSPRLRMRRSHQRPCHPWTRKVR